MRYERQQKLKVLNQNNNGENGGDCTAIKYLSVVPVCVIALRGRKEDEELNIILRVQPVPVVMPVILATQQDHSSRQANLSKEFVRLLFQKNPS
jgi:hypothetical protein